MSISESKGENRMEIGVVCETAEWRDYHENYLVETLGPLITKHRKGKIELFNGTKIYLIPAREKDRLRGHKLDKLFEFISDKEILDEVRKTLLPCLRKDEK